MDSRAYGFWLLLDYSEFEKVKTMTVIADASLLQLTENDLFGALRHEVPTLRLLAVYASADLQGRWAYDFQTDSFLSPARLRAIKPIPATEADFDLQVTIYTDAIELLLRLEDQLLLCLSSKDLTNVRLLEMAVRRFQAEILALPGPEKKSRAKADKATDKAAAKAGKSAAKSEKPVTAGEDLTQAELENLLARLSGYELLKVLDSGTPLPSFKLRQKTSGKLSVLKYVADGALLDRIDVSADFKRFEGHPALAAHLLIRPFIEGVSIRALIQKVNKLLYSQVLFMIVQLCETQQKLSQPHLGLTPNNILINQDKQILLVDGAMGAIHRARLAAGEAASSWSALHRSFLAPEFLDAGAGIQSASDIYAIAALALYMLVGHTAYEQAVAADGPGLLALAKQTLERRYPPFYALIVRMLSSAPAERPTAQAVILSVISEAKNQD